MKLERTKNATRNIIFGIILKLYQMLLPFVMRTAMIYFMGMKYLGLSSLFTSILQVLNLAELGVGSAMVYSMYKPIVEDDRETICALMRLYRLYYRIIGALVAILGVILMPFLPQLVKVDTVPKGISIYILYLLNLGATVLSYWLFAYKNSLLNAHQRTDVVSKITLGTNTLMYLFQFLVLALLHNYYLYVIIKLITQAVTNITTAVAVDKMYPNYKPEGKLDIGAIKQINHRVRDLFTAKLGGVILNAADTIVISAFLGLTDLAVYQNYYFILTSVIGIVSVVFGACTAGIGNSLIVDTSEKNFLDFETFSLIIAWVSGFCSCCMLCLFQPFMKLWVGSKYLLPMSAVVCFVIYYFIYEINQLFNIYKDAAGIWHEDRFRPLITATANLIMNIILVQFYGIYGVLLSTVIATLGIGMPWLLHNLFTSVFNKRYLPEYLRMLLFYAVITGISCLISYRICVLIDLSDLGNLIIRALICCIVPNVIYLAAYHKTSVFGRSVRLIDKMTKGKLNLSSKFKLG